MSGGARGASSIRPPFLERASEELSKNEVRSLGVGQKGERLHHQIEYKASRPRWQQQRSPSFVLLHEFRVDTKTKSAVQKALDDSAAAHSYSYSGTNMSVDALYL